MAQSRRSLSRSALAETSASEVSVRRADFSELLADLEASSADLILTDPPYAISRKTGFSSVGPRSVERFAVSMEFGAWDRSPIDLPRFAEASHRALRRGGTAIVFYDLWKITPLADALAQAGFKQLRLIEWLKTNPVPLNSGRNYLTNGREIAVSAVKGGRPTFNSAYDNGVYAHPIPNGSPRRHPTQKPIALFEELINKHSRVGDLVIDPFVGSGTTLLAARRLGRKALGGDIDADYVRLAESRLAESQAELEAES